jgi:hypothetical protein
VWETRQIMKKTKEQIETSMSYIIFISGPIFDLFQKHSFLVRTTLLHCVFVR